MEEYHVGIYTLQHHNDEQNTFSNLNFLTCIISGGYFATDVSDRLTVLTLNTMLWYQYDTLIDDSDDPDGQFAWLRTQLQQARDTNKNVRTVKNVPY